MKKTSILALMLSALLVSCGRSNGDKVQKEDEQEVAEQKGETYNVDSSISTLNWTGYHKGGFEPRFGTLQTEGNVAVENGAITGGSFIIDINSLITDEASVDPSKSEGSTALDLDRHLKNEDFFDVEKFPTAKFEITKVKSFDVKKDVSVLADATNIFSGNLTIKGKTVNVTFPVKVNVIENEITVQSKFTINRQDWGLTYGTDGDPKDWLISPEVDMEFKITAKK